MSDFGETFLIILLVIGVGWAGAILGKKEGRIQVASGQYSCAIIPNEDKTTKWECKPTKEGE